MRRALLAVAGGVLALALTGTAQAHEPHGPRPYHGVRFGAGFYYPEHHHPRWERRVWDARYCRFEYWDPYYRCYYYWSAAHHCYYPVGYVCP
jgi:hypothetical protein